MAKNRFASWDWDTTESIPALTKEDPPTTHADIGKVGIEALCGHESDGIDWFEPVTYDEPLPKTVNCDKCRKAFLSYTTLPRHQAYEV